MITRTKVLVAYLLLAAFLIGCAHVPSVPSEAQRADFGRVGIVYGSYVPQSNLDTFAKSLASGIGKGAAVGVGSGALGGASVGAWVSLAAGPVGILFLPFLAGGGAAIGAVVGLVGGSIAGGVTAIPKEKAEEIEAAIKEAFTELRIQETMAESIFKNCQMLSDYRFDLLENQGPVSPDQKPDYKILKEQGIDTVVEVAVKRFGLEGGRGSNPSISFFMNVQIRLLRLVDMTEIFAQEFMYTSPSRSFTEWSDNNGQCLKEEFVLCYGTLSEKIIEKLFLLYPIPL